jgi:hypothetical protein
MWKTLGGFTAQISRYQHILPLSTAQINCSGSDLPFFRKPCLSRCFREKEGDQFAENNPLLAATARDIRADVNQNCPTGMPQITA